MQVLHKLFGFNINTTAFSLGQSSLNLLQLKSSLAKQASQSASKGSFTQGVLRRVICRSVNATKVGFILCDQMDRLIF